MSRVPIHLTATIPGGVRVEFCGAGGWRWQCYRAGCKRHGRRQSYTLALRGVQRHIAYHAAIQAAADGTR